MLFGWNRADTETFARLAATTCTSALVSSNPLLLLVAVVALARTYDKARKSGEYNELADGGLKGVLGTTATLASVSAGVRFGTTDEDQIGLKIFSSNLFSEVNALKVDVLPGFGQRRSYLRESFRLADARGRSAVCVRLDARRGRNADPEVARVVKEPSTTTRPSVA